MKKKFEVLNSEGGETIVADGVIIAPETGIATFYNVPEVTDGEQPRMELVTILAENQWERINNLGPYLEVVEGGSDDQPEDA